MSVPRISRLVDADTGELSPRGEDEAEYRRDDRAGRFQPTDYRDGFGRHGFSHDDGRPE